MAYRFIVSPGLKPHKCSLPFKNTTSDVLTPNTVVQCDCGQMYVWQYSSYCDDGYSDGWGWERLSRWRPKHKTARRLVRKNYEATN